MEKPQKTRRKRLSARLAPERICVKVPADVFQWLKDKSNKERKSYSVIITEILKKEMEA